MTALRRAYRPAVLAMLALLAACELRTCWVQRHGRVLRWGLRRVPIDLNNMHGAEARGWQPLEGTPLTVGDRVLLVDEEGDTPTHFPATVTRTEGVHQVWFELDVA